MRRSTELVLRHRRIVLVAWIAALAVDSVGAANVGSLLAKTFSLPGSPVQRGLTLLHQRFHQRSDGAFTLVVVAAGLERTGRIITAAAVIMIAAFSGSATGRFVGLQEFGVGLAATILLDVTIVRALLVPATMKLLGRWNWYLPDGVRRAGRLAPEQAH